MPVRTFTTPLPVDLAATWRPLVGGRGDPTIRLGQTAAARAFHTPDGPTSLRLDQHGTSFTATAWGPGAGWALDHAAASVGADDDLDGFIAADAVVARMHRRRSGLRVIRTGLVGDVLVPTILAQKVTSIEAGTAWVRIVRWWGDPAPGPVGLRLPPTPDRLAGTPYHAYHRAGVERRRADTIIRACRRIDRLQEAVAMDRGAAVARLTALPGVGPWTAALVMRTAMGDADAVEVGDFHVKHQVAWNLAGEPRADDTRMLELLAPYAGHRGRVVRLLFSGCPRPPRYAPRQPLRDVAAL